MERVYDENDGYTSDAVLIDRTVRDDLRVLIRGELEAGTPIEALQCVLYNAIQTEILAQSISLKLRKKQKSDKEKQS